MHPHDIPGIDKPVLEGFSYGWETLAAHPERVIVDVTPPPNQQVVWKVRRYLAQQQIYRANALASLREQYGKEMATTPAVADVLSRCGTRGVRTGRSVDANTSTPWQR
jgi:hypothetical protein